MRLPFLGRWDCKIDGKRRFTMPAGLRELLDLEEAPHLITTVGQGGGLFVVPQAVWDELTPGLLRDTFQGDKGAARLRATFARYGSLNKLDGSGRLTLTEDQMEVGGIQKQAIVFGNFTRIEIWEPARFEISNPPIEDLAEHDALIARYMGQAETQAPQ